MSQDAAQDAFDQRADDDLKRLHNHLDELVWKVSVRVLQGMDGIARPASQASLQRSRAVNEYLLDTGQVAQLRKFIEPKTSQAA
jgi:hypothetical protein